MKYLGVKIPDELAEALEATERPKSEVVREALEAYLEVKRGIPYRNEIIKLIDERVAFYMGKTTVKPESNEGKTEVKPQVKPSKTTVKPESNEGKTEVKPQVKPSKTTVKPESNEGKTEVKPQVKPGKTTVKPEENEILQVIKSFHDRDKEPLVSEVAERMGMESRPMGRLLSKHGIRATKTHREGKPGRYFTFDQREKIKKLIANDETEK